MLSVETAFTSVKAIYSPQFQQSSTASKAPFSLFKEAETSVFSRSNFAKPFYSKIPQRPRFRKGSQNTVPSPSTPHFICKPQSAILSVSSAHGLIRPYIYIYIFILFVVYINCLFICSMLMSHFILNGIVEIASACPMLMKEDPSTVVLDDDK